MFLFASRVSGHIVLNSLGFLGFVLDFELVFQYFVWGGSGSFGFFGFCLDLGFWGLGFRILWIWDPVEFGFCEFGIWGSVDFAIWESWIWALGMMDLEIVELECMV